MRSIVVNCPTELKTMADKLPAHYYSANNKWKTQLKTLFEGLVKDAGTEGLEDEVELMSKACVEVVTKTGAKAAVLRAIK